MVRIRLFRMGKKHKPFYRIVVADARSPRDGKYIESIGWYDPLRRKYKLIAEKMDEWVAKGAKPTDAVLKIIEKGKGGYYERVD